MCSMLHKSWEARTIPMLKKEGFTVANFSLSPFLLAVSSVFSFFFFLIPSLGKTVLEEKKKESFFLLL